MSTQSTILEFLTTKPMRVDEIVSATATSAGYIRTQLKAMEAAGMVKRVDDRMPFIYTIGDGKSVADKDNEAVAKAKKQLLAESKDSDTFVSDYLKKYPKSKWLGAADMLIAFGHALKELDDEGKLIDTL